jgi:YggT family protein
MLWGVISLVFGFIEVVVGLRFIFLLLGASLDSKFVTWVYNISHPLVAPFGTIFGHTTKAVAGTIPGSSFEPASLVALIVYGLIGGILLRVTATRSNRGA